MKDGTAHTELFVVKIQHRGRRETFQLQTANCVEAAVKARTIWQHLVANGWETSLKKFKPEIYKKRTVATIGQYLAEVAVHCPIKPKTLENYRSKFVTLTRHVLGLSEPDGKHRTRNGGNCAWRDKVINTPLSAFSEERINRWKSKHLEARATNPVQRRKACTTIDSYIRTARTLFAPKMLAKLRHLDLPAEFPFRNIEFESKGRSAFRYRSTIDAVAITRAAVDELSDGHVEELKIILLGLHCGLRRNEIDKLLWRSFDPERKVLEIFTHDDFEAKSMASEDEISLEPEFVELLTMFRKVATGRFLVESKVACRPARYCHYRCAYRFKFVIKWLRSHGVDTDKPLHTLRKEYGRLITEQYGLYAASRALRHSSTQVTETYYADDRRRVATGLGKVIGSPL